jgi:hypothetical protein
LTARKHPEYTRHLWAAEAKAKGYAVDAYTVVEEMTGWALTAQLDPVVIEAALEARSAMRRVRNLLLPDETFADDTAPPQITWRPPAAAATAPEDEVRID